MQCAFNRDYVSARLITRQSIHRMWTAAPTPVLGQRQRRRESLFSLPHRCHIDTPHRKRCTRKWIHHYRHACHLIHLQIDYFWSFFSSFFFFLHLFLSSTILPLSLAARWRFEKRLTSLYIYSDCDYDALSRTLRLSHSSYTILDFALHWLTSSLYFYTTHTHYMYKYTCRQQTVNNILCVIKLFTDHVDVVK